MAEVTGSGTVQRYLKLWERFSHFLICKPIVLKFADSTSRQCKVAGVGISHKHGRGCANVNADLAYSLIG